MKYLLAFSLLFLTACGDEDENPACQGTAKYEFLKGNWVRPLSGFDNTVTYKLLLTFDDPGETEMTITYSCQNQAGILAKQVQIVPLVEHSPEQISIGYTGLMNPREGRFECGTFGFGGLKYDYELKGECLILEAGGNKIEFEKGL